MLEINHKKDYLFLKFVIIYYTKYEVIEMKQVVLEFDDEEMELLEEQFKQIQDVAGMETIEDYIYYATMSHCKTMQAASKMFGQSGDIEKIMADENVHVGVVNMPIQLSNVEDKDEFSRYLNDVLDDAVKDFMNRNNEPLN